MTLRYLVQRLLVFVLVMWVGMTLIFFLPRIVSDRDPVVERITMLLASGGMTAAGVDVMVDAYKAKFGLEQPMWRQYITYMNDMIHLDFNYSLGRYPTKVIEVILIALPWTIGLLTMSTLMAFTLGSLAGALMGWPRTPKAFNYLMSPFLLMSTVPYYIIGLILIYVFAFLLKWFPIGGGSNVGVLPTFSWSYIVDIVYHSLLPAASMVCAGMGFWALGMRGMMVTTLGDDFIILAQARGLSPRRIFFSYAMRNAMLPQITSLALTAGSIVSGSLLVETFFRYPGIGTALFNAISSFDYFVIYGVVFFIILAIATTTLLIDLVYPLLDPRIRYQRN